MKWIVGNAAVGVVMATVGVRGVWHTQEKPKNLSAEMSKVKGAVHINCPFFAYVCVGYRGVTYCSCPAVFHLLGLLACACLPEEARLTF